MVAFAGQVFAAHQAVKTHATELDAFSAPHAAALGIVSEAGVRYPAPIGKTRTVTPSGLTARVAMIPVITGDNGELLDRALPSFDGVVVVGYGTGNCPPGIIPAVVDSSGKSVPKGQGGWLVITRPWPSMLRGIWGDHARYKEQYWSKVPHNYLAGDNARTDEDGYYWIMGRIDDVLNVA